MKKLFGKFFKLLFSRLCLVGLTILIQVILLITLIFYFSNYYFYVYVIFTAISVAAVLWILNDRINPAYKIVWILPIVVFPMFGGLFYIFFGRNKASPRTKRKLKRIGSKMAANLHQNKQVFERLQQQDLDASNQARYLIDYSGCPVFQNTTAEYLKIGEEKFARLCKELEEAKHYIFLEYFIIHEGVMWNTILEILVRKVREGVDVRIIYDDVGCLRTLPLGYEKQLIALGIQCCVFNPFIPVLSTQLNNRDHRKIAVIDGHTAFTGGINLADEYINAIERFGHWKDTAIVVQGEAAWSFTVMFLSLWNYLKGTNENFEQFRPSPQSLARFSSSGYVQPYADSPLDYEAVGENVYLNLVGAAQRYVYITTPYLVLDNEMQTALCNAAKRGIDVRIITPHIPDKWYVHAVTKSNYQILVESGVKIYEYLPGFIHGKTFTVDDKFATVGTINLDYRSLYLHFECGVWLYNMDSVFEVKEDFLQTQKLSQEITLKMCQSVPWYIRLGRSVLRIFAPML